MQTSWPEPFKWSVAAHADHFVKACIRNSFMCLPCCHNSLNTAMVNTTKQTKAKAQTASFCCCCYFLLEIFCSFGVDSLAMAKNTVDHIVWIISRNLVKCSLILNSLVKISEDKKLWIKWRLQAIIIWYILRLVPWYWNVATPTEPLKISLPFSVMFSQVSQNATVLSVCDY